MSSAKSRNFRRRAGDDVDENYSSFTTPSSTNNPSATNKPISQPPKTLLSFADDEDESPFSRPPPSRSSASSSSAHKLSSSKDRITPHHPSSSIPSNVQPQAGVYTKGALLELQKNTKTLVSPARNKPKPPDPEPVVVLKGLIKPVISNDVDPGATGEGLMQIDEKLKGSSATIDDEIRKGDDDDEEMPDQAMIEKIKAKRERLRQVKAAAPDYIALDVGSNHGEAEGLSDEEPEFLGRIGFFGEKISGQDDMKGVSGDFEERAVIKERRTEVVSDEEDDEDKMWEEEQVRKGLGKRLDEGVGNQGVGVISVNGVGSVRQSSVMHTPAQNVDSASSYSSGGGVNVDMFSTDAISKSQQAELAKKALSENLKRVQESHGRTMISLAKTEENLTSSLMNVTSLENALSATEASVSYSQSMDDEYEKLIRRMNPPRVIDNESCKNATVIQVDSANKQGILLEVVQVLTDLNLVVNKAYICSDGGWFMDVFNVTDNDGNKITDESILNYIQKSLGPDSCFASSMRSSVGLTYGPDHTSIELIGTDRPDLLSEVSAVLTHLKCNVVSAEVWTHNTRAAAVMQVTDKTIGDGSIADPERLTMVKRLLCNVSGEATSRGARRRWSRAGLLTRRDDYIR